MFERLLEKLRGSSRAPDDLALGTTRPGDFADDPATREHEGEGLAPNPHEEYDRGRAAELDAEDPT